MDKKYRKQIEHQLEITINYFLRKTDEKVADKISKHIKSAAKDIAKKFVKAKHAEADKIQQQQEEIKTAAVKNPAKKTVRKTAAKKVKRARKVKRSGKTVSAKKTAAKKTE